MPLRPIVFYPAAGLNAVAAPIAHFNDELRQLAHDLLDTLRAAPGIGITGPHIGCPWRIVVLDLPGTDGPQTYINPQIIEASDETIRHAEGSISMPGVTDLVERAARVRVRYQDLSGTEQFEEAQDLRAMCHQHEIDQLNGLFWLHRLSPMRRTRAIARYNKLRRQAG